MYTSVVTWSSVCCMFGMALTRPSSTMQLKSGVDVFAHVCHGIDQTIIDNAIEEWRGCLCACVPAKGRCFEQLLWQYFAIWRDVSVFDKCDDFLDFFVYYHKFKLLTLARYCGNLLKVWWELLYETFGRLLFFPSVKEFWISIKNWQSYRHEFDVLLFGDTVYICTI